MLVVTATSASALPIKRVKFETRFDALTSNGAWSFFGDPRAVRSGDRTFVGWATGGANVQIGSIRDGSENVRTHTLTPNLGTRDDHNNPGLFLRKDGRITAFYSPHSGTKLPRVGVSRLYYTTMKEPGNVDSWSSVRTIPTNTSGGLGFTYPNPVPLNNGGIYLAWRGGNWMPTFTFTAGNGWAKARSVVRIKGDGGFPPSRPYAKFAAGNDGSVLIAYNTDHPHYSHTSQYFVRYRPGKGYFRADGKKIAGPYAAVKPWRADTVQTAKSHGNTWVMDVAEDAKKRPVVLYMAGYQGREQMVYYVARFEKGRWKHRRIATTGWITGVHNPKQYGFYPTSGASIDHGDPSTVYISRIVDSTRLLAVEKWDLKDPDNFDSQWRVARLNPKGTNCFRPADVRGAPPGNVAMMCGKYGDWRRFWTGIYLVRPK